MNGDRRDGKERPGRNDGSFFSFVVQEHHARTHHYDFRLEHDGVLKSWAVPKGMPDLPGQRRLAVETEDHPLDYATFEGVIPEGEPGAGTVLLWDHGTFRILSWEKDRIEVFLEGQRLQGKFVLLRFRKAGEKDWLVLRAKN
ncbi:MAG TPA: DNA polymerase ligase N-terminal domain-containing protein [Methanolinea sp.]|nr:DNA polymerase ligase N-terminal domain-containing protein [Methanolinea sp.]